jgi:hypothetical protein
MMALGKVLAGEEGRGADATMSTENSPSIVLRANVITPFSPIIIS